MSEYIIVKYCIDNGGIRTIRIKRSRTVGEFLEEVRNFENNQDLIEVYLRGRPIDHDDLIVNFVRSSTDVLIVSDDNEKIFDDYEIPMNEFDGAPVIEQTSDDESKSLIRFKIYTTATKFSFINGDFLEFELSYTHEMVHSKLKELIQSFEEPKIPKDFEIHIFFPGGIYFSPSDGEIDSNLESFYSLNNKMDHKLYVVVTKPLGDFIDEEIKEPCSILDFNKNIISPLFESTTAGLTQIASLLGYIYYGGFNAQHLIEVFTITTRFSPMSVNLYRLHQHFELNVLNIIAITGPLFQYVNNLLHGIELENVFEYIIPVISFVGLINQSELKKIDYLTFDLSEPEKKIEKEKDDDDDDNCYLKLFNYLKSFDNQQHVVVWNHNLTTYSFGFNIDPPTNDIIVDRELFEAVTTYKPISPISLDLVYHPTFVKGINEEVFLFINHDYEDENFVYYIDPKVGRVEKSSIENLSVKYGNAERDEYIKTVDPDLVDQIVVVCFNLSSSMNLNVKGEKVNDGEMSRLQLSKDFLSLFIDESKKLKDSTINRMISFNNLAMAIEQEVDIPTQFFNSLTDINHIDDSTRLFDALMSAANIIQEINCDEDDLEDDEEVCFNYKNAVQRIIVISDRSDDILAASKDDLAKYLIKKNIVLDTIFVSEKIEQNFLCAISKLTGGACFQLKNMKDAFNIIEQEAFINAKLREFDQKKYSEFNDSEFNDSELIEKASNFDAFDVELNNIKIRNSQKLNSLEKPESMILKYKNKIETHLDFLALKELNYVCLNPHQNFIVFSESSTPTEWHIFIKGPNETPFENKWLALFMSLSIKFPHFPPSFTFMTAPFHPNVARDGRVAFSLIEKKYKIGVPIASMIEEIINLLKYPDENCVINHEANDLFISDKIEFSKRQNDFISIQLEKYGIEPI